MEKYPITRWTALNNSWEVRQGIKEFLDIGPVPHDEKCTPCGFDHIEDSIVECSVYIDQLIRYYGQPPAGASFVIIKNIYQDETHPGEYYEAGIEYYVQDQDARVYAEDKVQFGLDKWDGQALTDLREAGHYLYTAKIVNFKVA